jgi:prophage tail gpP-like protein
MPLLNEIAEIDVGGKIYNQWKSVMVKCPAPGAGPFREFQFTSSEDVTPQGTFEQNPQNWQIKPGDAVTIKLAGITVLTGYVNVRQVFAEKEQHGVMIAGRGRVQDAVDSAAIAQNMMGGAGGAGGAGGGGGGGGEFRGQTWTAIAQQLLGPVSIGLLPLVANMNPFKEAQIVPGESIYNMLDRLAAKRGIVMGENALGMMIATQMGVPLGVGNTLIEGINILEERVTFRDDSLNNPMMGWGQQKGDDQSNGQQTSQVSAFQVQGGVNRYRPALIPANSPVTQMDMQQLVETATAWAATTQIDAEIVVQGWQSSPGVLWNPGDMIPVRSPMAPLNQSLNLWVATFMQDNTAGTTTRLELKKWAATATDWGTKTDNAPDVPSAPQDTTPAQPLQPGGAGVPGAGTAL